MPSERESEPKSSKGEPPSDPPVALGLFDEDDYIRHLGDRIAVSDSTGGGVTIYI